MLVSVVFRPGYVTDPLSSLWAGVLLEEFVEDKFRFMDENTFVTEATPILHAIVANEVQVHGVPPIWWIVSSQSVKLRNQPKWGSDRRRWRKHTAGGYHTCSSKPSGIYAQT
jgi:hypothetical protein